MSLPVVQFKGSTELPIYSPSLHHPLPLCCHLAMHLISPRPYLNSGLRLTWFMSHTPHNLPLPSLCLCSPCSAEPNTCSNLAQWYPKPPFHRSAQILSLWSLPQSKPTRPFMLTLTALPIPSPPWTINTIYVCFIMSPNLEHWIIFPHMCSPSQKSKGIAFFKRLIDDQLIDLKEHMQERRGAEGEGKNQIPTEHGAPSHNPGIMT